MTVRLEDAPCVRFAVVGILGDDVEIFTATDPGDAERFTRQVADRLRPNAQVSWMIVPPCHEAVEHAVTLFGRPHLDEAVTHSFPLRWAVLLPGELQARCGAVFGRADLELAISGAGGTPCEECLRQDDFTRDGWLADRNSLLG